MFPSGAVPPITKTAPVFARVRGARIGFKFKWIIGMPIALVTKARILLRSVKSVAPPSPAPVRLHPPPSRGMHFLGGAEVSTE